MSVEGEVLAGYKRTEVGVIPDGWEISSVGDLNAFVTSGSRGWAAFYANRGALFVRITNLSRGRIYLDLADPKFVNLPADATEGSRTQLRVNDVLISITADIGIIGYVDGSVPSPAYINQHIALVRFDPSCACARFVAYFLASEMPQRAFRSITDVGAKAGLSLVTVRKVVTALPPLREQRAIADALGDVDALLDALDRLIAKQRDLQQAAMQQLLTGRTRLPGFTGEWRVKSLGDLCDMKAGEGITSAKISAAGPYACYGGNGLRGYATTFTHHGEYVLIGRQGALCGNVVFAHGKFYASEHALVVTPKPGISVGWLGRVLRSMRLNQYSESSAQPGLSAAKLLLLEALTPPTEDEQTAIAAVLSDMDAEIAALAARRAKTRDLKQAMLQELLTGRTRLV